MLEPLSPAVNLFKVGVYVIMILSPVIFLKGYFTLKVASGNYNQEEMGKEMMKTGIMFLLFSSFAVYLINTYF